MTDIDIATDPHDDLFDRTFHTFTEEASRELTVPGSAAAHRTVRRRRAGTALASLLALAAVASGAFGIVAAVHPDGTNTAGGTNYRNAPHKYTDDQLTKAAMDVLGPQVAPPVPGAPVYDTARLIVTPHGTATHSTLLQPGDYTLELSCSGQGMITLTQVPAMIPTESFGCMPPEQGDHYSGYPFHLAAPTTIQTIAHQVPNKKHPTVDHIGVALAIVNADAPNTTLAGYTDQATAVVGGAKAVRRTGAAEVVGVGEDPVGNDNRTPAGRHLIRFACVGAGTVHVRLVKQSWSVQCSTTPTVHTWKTSSLPKNDPSLIVQGSLGSAGQAAFAYSLT